ncbi:U-box domain-containing protein 33 [Monoraphidium neglectum]|uniref:U-box domain-containing protein 33 n=1 Tax=Monoraphidium neglectum TaxID=145388 RepID=A0A0D2NIX6_9CHLO|nr:U-box domain-containing protein 33 [Monoraphidium neglectum]KIZ04871.1 U-box domain-containing protein 33 [Monoraphidium neglectum]|eukprot:XP_013903890.1 U-box domain-containing protein 33 [Monoraphidium neglectum]
MLVWEFMEGGSLEGRLFSSSPRPPLTWQERVRLCFEVAAALTHLHSSEPPMVHGAVMPSNVLLDAHMRAKLSVDLATVSEAAAKLLCGCELPPQFEDPDTDSTGCMSHQTDTYQLGVTMLQLLTRRHDPGLCAAAEAAVAAANTGDGASFAALLDASAGAWPQEHALMFARLALRLVPNLNLRSAINEWLVRTGGRRLVCPSVRRPSPGSSASSSSQEVPAARPMEWEGSATSLLAGATSRALPGNQLDAELRAACARGDAHHVAELLASGASAVTADARDGHTALHCAAQGGSLAAVELLLGCGAQVDAVARDGFTTPLLLACMGGHQEVVLRLLSRRASTSGAVAGAWSPLHAAAACNREKVMWA